MTPARPLKKVGIYIEPPRGGFGDVAPNLLMAHNLAAAQEAFHVSLIVNSRAFQQLKALVPEFDPSLPHQKLGPFHVYPENGNVKPSLDLLLSFSSRVKGPLITNSPYLKSLAPIRMSFLEPGANGANLPRATGSINFSREGSFRVGCDLHLKTGVAFSGLYLSGKKQSVQIRPDALYKMVRAGLDRESATWFSENVSRIGPQDQIGFIYSKFANCSQFFVDHLINHFAKTQVTQPLTPRRTLVFIRNHESLCLPKSKSGLLFVPYQTMRFETSRALISQANIPILVTGDTSLALAIEFSKTFFYEANSWKRSVASDLIDLMFPQSKKLHSNPKWRQWLETSLLLDPDQPQISGFSQLLLDQDYQSEFQRSLEQLTSSISLSQNVLKYWSALSPLDFEYLAASGRFEDVVSFALSRSEDNLSQFSFGEIRKCCLLLISQKKWKTAVTTDFFSKILAGSAHRPKLAVSDFLLGQVRQDPRVYELIHFLLETGSASVRTAVLRILHQAHSALDSEDPMSLSSNIATQILNEHIQNQKRRSPQPRKNQDLHGQ